MTSLDPQDRSEECAWSGVIRLNYLIDTADEVSEALFGLSKRALRGHDLGFRPVALARGIPTNPSDEVKGEMERIRKHEERFGGGEFTRFSHVYYDEIQTLDWPAFGVTSIESSDWALVFRLIEDIRTCDRFRKSACRIVSWSNW
jgi:hypothetical protein